MTPSEVGRATEPGQRLLLELAAWVPTAGAAVVTIVVGLIIAFVLGRLVRDRVGAIVVYIPGFVAAGALTLFGFVAADFLSRLVERFGEARKDLVAPRFVASVTHYVGRVVVPCHRLLDAPVYVDEG